MVGRAYVQCWIRPLSERILTSFKIFSQTSIVIMHWVSNAGPNSFEEGVFRRLILLSLSKK